jgi:hypothetical protein
VYATHSIQYDDLRSYFLGFSIWNSHNVCLSWDETLEWFDIIGVTPVQVLFDGMWQDFYDDRESMDHVIADFGKEGYVVRLADSFHFDDFQNFVAKYVRRDHVQTDEHWMNGPVVANRLA